MTLSDKQLNKLAAELMGWVWVDEGDKHDWPLYYCVNNGIREFVMQVKHWNPATDLAHAFMLQDEIERRGLQWEFTIALGSIVIKQEMYHTWQYANATPRQRTEAAVKAVQG